MPELEAICRATEIAEGEAKSFEIKGKRIGVYHLTDGFYAIDDPCPHAGASLALGCIVHDVIHCRIHHWGFGIKDGLCREQNILQHNVRTYKVQVQDGQVLISTTPS